MILVVLFGVVIVSAALYILYTRDQRVLRLPPGPPPKPLIGNVADIPGSHAWLYYAGLKEKYGDVVHLNALGQHIIVLNSYKAAKELLQQRSSIYNDRPRSILIGEAMGWDQGLVFSHDGPLWRGQRKVFSRYLNKTAMREYYPLLRNEARMCLAHCLEVPTDFMPQVRLTLTRLILGLTYGLNIESTEDKYLKLLVTHSEQFTLACTPLIEAFPSLRHLPAWLPGMGTFRRRADKGAEELRRVRDEPYDHVAKEMASGTAPPSFCLSMLEDMRDGTTDTSEHSAKWSCASMYAAGIDTSYALMNVFFLAMVLYPEVQRKAQEEVDRMIGRDRLPSYEDKDSLPYIECVMKELHRWHTIVPTAIPHYTNQDDIYRDFIIPKGSIVIPNSWAISQDEELYPEPRTFQPERFLSTKEFPGAMDPRLFSFGYGKRVCAGQNFAEAALFTLITTFLATTTVKGTVSSLDFSGDIISRPEGFNCSIQPRFEDTATVLQTDVEVGP